MKPVHCQQYQRLQSSSHPIHEKYSGPSLLGPRRTLYNELTNPQSSSITSVHVFCNLFLHIFPAVCSASHVCAKSKRNVPSSKFACTIFVGVACFSTSTVKPKITLDLKSLQFCCQQLPLHANQPARAEELFRRRNTKLQVSVRKPPTVRKPPPLPQGLARRNYVVRKRNVCIRKL